MYSITTPGGFTYKPPHRKCWTKIEGEYKKLLADGRMWFGKDGKQMPRRKTYLNESPGITVWTWWTNKEVGHNQEAKQESVKLFGEEHPFTTPKPERLIQRIIYLCTNENDIVLDFFAGSGTTPAVTHKMGRKYIAVEQLEYDIDYISERLNKVLNGEDGGISKAVGWKGGGSFVYAELKKWNQNYIDEIEEDTIIIYHIKHRKEAYR